MKDPSDIVLNAMRATSRDGYEELLLFWSNRFIHEIRIERASPPKVVVAELRKLADLIDRWI